MKHARLSGGPGDGPTPEAVEEMLKDLEMPRRPLTSWELGFVASIANQLEYGRRVSERQGEVLRGIHKEKCE